jgi:RNA polymerase sigma factor (sigma-70 family)
MIDFDIEKFVRAYMTKRPESLLRADFIKYADKMHQSIDGKRILVIGGAGTIGSNYVKAALRGFKPKAMYVVDIDENQLAEVTDGMVDEVMLTDDEDNVAQLQKAIDMLAAEDRTLITLYYYDDRSVRDIAYIMSIKENAVVQRLHRVRKRLYLLIKTFSRNG